MSTALHAGLGGLRPFDGSYTIAGALPFGADEGAVIVVPIETPAAHV